MRSRLLSVSSRKKGVEHDKHGSNGYGPGGKNDQD